MAAQNQGSTIPLVYRARLEAIILLSSCDLSGTHLDNFFVDETCLTRQKVTQMTRIVQVIRPTSNAEPCHTSMEHAQKIYMEIHM